MRINDAKQQSLIRQQKIVYPLRILERGKANANAKKRKERFAITTYLMTFLIESIITGLNSPHEVAVIPLAHIIKIAIQIIIK